MTRRSKLELFTNLGRRTLTLSEDFPRIQHVFGGVLQVYARPLISNNQCLLGHGKGCERVSYYSSG